MLSAAPRYASNEGVIDLLTPAIGEALIESYDRVGEVTFVVARTAIVDVLRTLRDDFAYQQLMEIAGVDYPERPERFEVVYHLLSVTKNHRVRVKVSTDEVLPVPSVTALWPVAGWLEREVFDMFGVLFSGNADLRRILTDYGFRGHPFRKDFPLTGYLEMRYSEEAKRVVYEPVKLSQDLRSFDFLSPWEGAEYALPGDEKALLPEAKGASTPLSADAIVKAGANGTPAIAPPGDVKVTETVKETGNGGSKGDEPASKPLGHAQPVAVDTGKEGQSAMPPVQVDTPPNATGQGGQVKS